MKPARLRIGQRLIARDGNFLENLILFGDLLHLRLDGREVFR